MVNLLVALLQWKLALNIWKNKNTYIHCSEKIVQLSKLWFNFTRVFIKKRSLLKKTVTLTLTLFPSTSSDSERKQSLKQRKNGRGCQIDTHFRRIALMCNNTYNTFFGYKIRDKVGLLCRQPWIFNMC